MEDTIDQSVGVKEMANLYSATDQQVPPSLGYTSTFSPEMQKRLLEAQINSLHKSISTNLKALKQDDCYNAVQSLVKLDAPLSSKCKLIDVEQLFQLNTQNEGSLEKLQMCFNIISKYGQNLLTSPSNRPPNWTLLKFSNPVFTQKVVCIQGARKILVDLGYSNTTPEGLSYPYGMEPDRDKVSRYTADLLTISSELEAYINKRHLNPHNIDQLVPLNLRIYNVSTFHPIQHGPPVPSMSQPGLPVSSSTIPYHGSPVPSKHGFMQQRVLPNVCEGIHGDPPLPLVPGMSGDQPSPGDQGYHPKVKQGHTEPGDEEEFHDAMEQLDDNMTDICDICGCKPPVFTCKLCDNQILCADCDETLHNHRRRKSHVRDSYTAPLVINKPPPVQPNYGVGARPKVPTGMINMNAKPSDYTGTPGPDNMPILSIFERDDTHSKVPSSMAQKLTNQQESKRPVKPTLINETFNEPVERSRMPVSLSNSPSSSLDEASGMVKLSLLDEVKAIADKGERIKRIKQEVGKIDNLLDQYKQEVNIIFRREENFEENKEYQRLSKQRDRLNRDKMLIEEHWKELEKEKHDQKQTLTPSKLGSHGDTSPRGLKSSVDNEFPVEIKYPPSHGPILNLDLEQSDVLQGPVSKRLSLGTPSTNPKPKAQKQLSEPRTIGATSNNEHTSKRHLSELSRLPHAWVCNHCTFHNNMKDKACCMCSKSSEKPSLVFKEEEEQEQLPLFDEIKENIIFPETPKVKEKPPDGASASAIKEYKSVFVNEQDEIFREKKLAQERFRQRQNEGGNSQPSEVPPLERDIRQTEPINKQLTIKPVDQETVRLRQTVAVDDQKKGGDTQTKLEHLTELRQQEEASIHAKEIIRTLRKAENEGYNMTAIEIALEQTECADPFKWLNTNWKQQITDLSEQATQALQLSHNTANQNQDIPQTANQNLLVSETESEKALIDCMGDVGLALHKILVDWENTVDELLETYQCNHNHVIELLKTHNFNKDATDSALCNELFLPFESNLWPDDLDQVEGRQAETSNMETRLRNTDIDMEVRTRMMLCEYEKFLNTWGRAEAAVKVLEQVDLTIPLCEVVEAVRQCGDRHRALEFLQQECLICYSIFPANMILSTVACQCKVCRECMKGYFENQIKEKHIKNLNCPACQEPDIETTDDYLTFLDNFLRPLISIEVYDLFQGKVRDWNLMADPNFRWCSTENCENGFIFKPEGRRLKMGCDKCNKYTCFECKKPWEDQHMGITCEEFRKWKEENNPEYQEAGLARHLQDNGIDCPKCKMRYSLAKGGCMHFKCTACGHEFCCGCNKPFMQGKACKELNGCKKAGLHCHHPRDCLYYLRDLDVNSLQELLEEHNVQFKVENPQGNVKCQVMEQKELQAGLRDEPCGKDIGNNQAGLCSIHYKEYLVSKINSEHIDPVSIMELNDLNVQYLRREKQVPQKRDGESETQYKQRLINDVKQKFPLDRRIQIEV